MSGDQDRNELDLPAIALLLSVRSPDEPQDWVVVNADDSRIEQFLGFLSKNHPHFNSYLVWQKYSNLVVQSIHEGLSDKLIEEKAALTFLKILSNCVWSEGMIASFKYRKDLSDLGEFNQIARLVRSVGAKP